MLSLGSFVRGLVSVLHGRSRERELEEELQGFVNESTVDKMHRGMSLEEAARAARVEMGSMNAVKHRVRSVGWESHMEVLLLDLRYALRTLMRSPAFTLVAVFSLALGIGANTAIFTLVRQVVLQQIPVRSPEQLVTFGESGFGGILGGIDLGTADMFTYDFAQQLEQQPGPFQGVASYSSFAPTVNVRVPGAAAAIQVPCTLVSGNFFEVLGAAPLLGHTISAQDAKAIDGNPVAVISYHFWQQSMSGDPSALGKTIAVDGTPFNVIAVMPEAFHGLKQGIQPNDLWVPLTMAQEILLEPHLLAPRDHFFLHMVARRKAGAPLATDQNWLDRQLRDYVRAGEGASIVPARQQEIQRLSVPLVPAAHGVSALRSHYRDSLLILMVIVGVVLLIACANLANFLLARAVVRQREVATRLALGSSRARIVRQSVLEAILLSFTGGALGLAFAFVTTRALIAFVVEGAPSTILNAQPDAAILAFTFGVSIAAGLLFGFAPALQVAHSSAGAALNSSSRTAMGAAGRAARFWPKALVTSQIVLSLLLLVAAGLFLRTLRNLQNQDLGFERTHLLIGEIQPGLAGYQPEQMPVLNQRLLETLAAIPGVRSAALAEQPPISSSSWRSSVQPDGYQPAPHEDMSPILKRVSGRYFETTGSPIAAGRPILPSDVANSQRVIVVNETFARKYFPHGDAIGHTVHIDIATDARWVIVGVARDTRDLDPREAPDSVVYLPLAQLVGKHGEGIHDSYANTVLLRTAGDPAAVTRDLRHAIATVDPNLPLLQIRTIQQHVQTFMSSETLITRLTTAFAALAVLLAAIGLYGVMTFNVARQTNEIGIRVALGASSSSVQWMVLRDSLTLLAAGLVIGLPLALIAARFLRAHLFGMSPFDPLIFAAATAGIAAVTLISAWLPARRAAAIEPMSALRCD